ncbi:MAG: hypothetical protein ACKVPX_12195 [Myxococcaceae bacterium]
MGVPVAFHFNAFDFAADLSAGELPQKVNTTVLKAWVALDVVHE